eukprot:5559195-Pyramimonas_sp.AAC.1
MRRSRRDAKRKREWRSNVVVRRVFSRISSDGRGPTRAEQGWYDGAGIAFAIILVVLVTAVNDYRQ